MGERLRVAGKFFVCGCSMATFGLGMMLLENGCNGSHHTEDGELVVASDTTFYADSWFTVGVAVAMLTTAFYALAWAFYEPPPRSIDPWPTRDQRPPSSPS